MRAIASAILTATYWAVILYMNNAVEQTGKQLPPNYGKGVMTLLLFGTFMGCVTAFLITIGV